jgi:hypothetical protein
MAISREARLTVTVEHKHMVYDSRLADAVTFGNIVTRTLYRILSKSPKGATYVSTARMTFAAEGKEQTVGDVRCIDEVMKYAW